MFSNNDKISSRQIKRLLIFDLFGVSSLLLPTQLAQAGHGAGLWSIPIGIGMAGLYLWLLHICSRQMTQDYLGFLQKGWGRFPAGIIFICYALISVLACAWASKLMAQLVCDSLLERREFPMALLFIVLLALYGGIAGLEARARIYEIMFWVLAVPVIIMLLLCVRQVQAAQWFPLLPRGGMDGLWKGAWQCFAAFLPLTFLLFLMPHVQEKKKTSRAAAGALTVSGVALAVVYLILLGIFGSGALAQEQYPVITLMGMVKIPGGFVKRLDAVMIGVWFFTLYALIGTTLYYGVIIVHRALGKQDRKGGFRAGSGGNWRGGRNYWFCAAAAAVYAAAYGFYRFPQMEAFAGRAFYLAGTPFMVFVPVVSIVLCRVRKKG